MSHRLRSWKHHLAAIIIAATTAHCVQAQSTARGGTDLQFSAPRQREQATNLFSRFRDRKAELEQMERSLYAPDQPAPRGNSMDGVFPPRVSTPRPATPERRARELQELRREWLLTAAGERRDGITAEEVVAFGELDSQAKGERKLTPSERLYLSLYGHQRNGQRAAEEDPARTSTTQADREESDLPPSLREQETDLRRLITGEAQARGAGEGALGSLFTTGKGAFDFSSFDEAQMLPEPTEAQKLRMGEFRQLLGMPPTPMSATEAFKQLNTPVEPGRSLTAPLLSGAAKLPEPAGNSLSGLRSPAGGLPQLPTAPDARALAPSALGSPLPQSEPPSKLAPPTPTFTAPKRKF